MAAASRLMRIRDRLGGRLLKAIAFSVLLHLSLIVLIQPTRREGTMDVVLQARIVAETAARLPPSPVETRVPTNRPNHRPEQVPIPSATLSELRSAEPWTEPEAVLSETVSAPGPTQEQSAPPQPEAVFGGTPQAAQADVAVSDTLEVTPSGPATGLPEIPVMLDMPWFTARQVDVLPRPLQTIQPQYPEEARMRGVQGSVVLQLKIDEFGVVQDIEVVESSPPRVFDQSSLDAFRTARFHPAQRDGRAVRALVRIRVTYELD